MILFVSSKKGLISIKVMHRQSFQYGFEDHLKTGHKSHNFVTFMTTPIWLSHESHKIMTFAQKTHLERSVDTFDYTR